MLAAGMLFMLRPYLEIRCANTTYLGFDILIVCHREPVHKLASFQKQNLKLVSRYV
jgi:hypothetical protein